jgi:AGCS family alanine or glycine:cation symporter
MALIDNIFGVVGCLEDFMWSYCSFSFILAVGTYFSIKSRFYQFKTLFNFKARINDLKVDKSESSDGLHPLKIYFSSVGLMVGPGNLAMITTAVTVGGPGSLVWVWIASFIGMLIKYSEIYLSIKYRQKRGKTYDGGCMYFLKAAFKNRWIPTLACLFLCLYGADMALFTVTKHSMVDGFGLSHSVATATLLGLIILASTGGMARLSNVCSLLMPPFILIYIAIGIWIIIQHSERMPELLAVIWHSAFHGHAAVGGFAGSTMLMAAHYGMSRAVYSGDIGVGLDSVIQSETRIEKPHQQARLSIVSLFTDTFVCTMTLFIILLTGVWTQTELQPSQFIYVALADYIPYSKFFVGLLFFVAGFTTIASCLVVGQKCARYLNEKHGSKIYLCYATIMFLIFSFVSQQRAILIMSLAGAILITVNLAGIVKLRREIKFE